MQVFIKLFIQIYFLLLIQNLIRAHELLSNGSNCFENYLQQLSFLNKEYLEFFKSCEKEDNENRLPPKILDPEAERKKLQIISKETCFNLTACSGNEKSIEFFNCHSKIAASNMNKFAAMHLHTLSLVIELNTDHTEKEKEIFRCHLAAKRKLMEDFFSAYTYHLKCLNVS